jgi:hypothetical protein
MSLKPVNTLNLTFINRAQLMMINIFCKNFMFSKANQSIEISDSCFVIQYFELRIRFHTAVNICDKILIFFIDIILFGF